jgi:3-oxoacyl-(acyl-carrier-protein) synthase
MLTMLAETRPRYFEQGFAEHAKSIGVGEGLKPADRVVVFATAGRTPSGTIPETFDAAMRGESGIKEHGFIENWRSNLAGLTEFDPKAYFDRKELKRMTGVEALSIVLAREIMANTELLDENGQLKNDDLQRSFGICVGSGVGPTPHLAKVLNAIEGGIDKATGEKSRIKGSRSIDFNAALYSFPQ